MKVQTIRFSPETWPMIQEQARLSGVSAGQFVREAALVRAFVLAAGRGGGEYKPTEVWLRALDALERAGV
jgi:hypothetical protein